MIKKILTTTIGIGMVLASVAPAFAGISIFNTGQGSNLDTRITRVKNHVFTLTNNYTLNQNATANQSTGGNAADNNTGSGTSVAGNVTGNHTAQVEANSSNVDIDLTDNSTCNCDNNITVNTTGQNSTANAVIDSTHNLTVTLTNDGSVNNTFTSIVNTGGNSANNNTGNGTAAGGDVSVWSLVTTKLNSIFYKIKM